MQFTYDITVLPNTIKEAPKREITKLCYGALKRVQIDFPWGCAGLVGVRIVFYEHQLYPTNHTAWFIGNDSTIIFDCDFLIAQGWNAFKVEGYNEDDFHSHTPVVNFNVLPVAGMPIGFEPWVGG